MNIEKGSGAIRGTKQVNMHRGSEELEEQSAKISTEKIKVTMS